MEPTLLRLKLLLLIAYSKNQTKFKALFNVIFVPFSGLLCKSANLLPLDCELCVIPEIHRCKPDTFLSRSTSRLIESKSMTALPTAQNDFPSRKRIVECTEQIP